MSNEITLNATLSYTYDTVNGDTLTKKTINRKVDQTYFQIYGPTILDINSLTGEAITFATTPVNTKGYVFIKNVTGDSSVENYISIGYDDGSARWFTKVHDGEIGLFRFNTAMGEIYAKVNNAGIQKLLIVLLEE